MGALAVLLKDAILPNLVQTLEGQPAFVHGGPFANIAHGNNSIIATRLGLRLADYVVTEGGFAADLGAEKFFDIVTRVTDLKPDVAVLVATVRALKFHGGVARDNLNQENLEALKKGIANLDQHIDNLRNCFGLPVVVAINRFPSDTEAELELLMEHCRGLGVSAALSEVVAKGGDGGIQLAEAVLKALEEENEFTHAYPWIYQFARRLRCWRKRFIVPMELPIQAGPAGALTPWKNWGMGTCLSVSPRPRCPLAMIRH